MLILKHPPDKEQMPPHYSACEKGIQLITTVKKNMKNKLLPLADKILLRKRSIIETINDQLKNISQIEHTRHRSVTNFMINLLCGLISDTFQEKKPAIRGIEILRKEMGYSLPCWLNLNPNSG